MAVGERAVLIQQSACPRRATKRPERHPRSFDNVAKRFHTVNAAT